MDPTARAAPCPPCLCPPLSPQQQQAADDSLAYAVAHDLFLGLDEADHLVLFHGHASAAAVATDEELSLADTNLPPLVVPTAAVAEQWAVPRRVAALLEASCAWLSPDELAACEAAVLGSVGGLGGVGGVGVGVPLKLDRPLLCSDPADDCAELARVVARLSAAGPDRLLRGGHDHAEQRPDDEEAVLFAVPPDARDAAARLDAAAPTETMAVPERVVRLLVDRMGAAADDPAAQTARPPPRLQRRISPPLPPVLPREEDFVPAGDACLVSDASDFSSGVSEALGEAEQLLADRVGDTQTPGDVQGPGDAFAIEYLDSCLRSSSLHDAWVPGLGSKPEHALPLPAMEDQQLLSAWIDESMFSQADSDDPPPSSDSRSEGDGEEGGAGDAAAARFLETDQEAAAAAAAAAPEKLPVPTAGLHAAPPPWSAVGAAAEEMLRWMMGRAPGAFCFEAWPLDAPPDDDDELSGLAERTARLLCDTLPLDQPCMDKLAHLLGTSTSSDAQGVSFASEPPPSTKKKQEDELIAFSPGEAAEKPAPGGGGTWGSWMNRWKRRKKEGAHGQAAPPSREHPGITAPELVLGVRGFGPAEEAAGRGDAGACPPAVAALASPAAHDPPPATELPRVILSTGVHRALRAGMLAALPGLRFVERDYQRGHGCGDDEADVVAAPSTGILTATMVSLRQCEGQRGLAVQGRVARAAEKYEELHVLIYSNSAKTAAPDDRDRDDCDDLPELSPSDAMAFAQLQGLARGLPCRAVVSYVGGGVEAAARRAAALVRHAAPAAAAAQAFLVEADTRGQVFLRQAGLNAYDAQIVLGVLRSAVGSSGRRGDEDGDEARCLARFLGMSAAEREDLFGRRVGCRRALASVNRVLLEPVGGVAPSRAGGGPGRRPPRQAAS